MSISDEIPHAPGCYLFFDSSGRVLYVGKAKDLRKRIASYFQKTPEELGPKTAQLVPQISRTEFIATRNELEALVLESNLVKKHQPKYNVKLKDASRYAYIMITKEDFPRILLARIREAEGQYFGPFTSSSERDSVLFLVNKIFRLRTCRRTPKKPCLRHHLKMCDAPCAGRTSREEYGKRISKAAKILGGNVKELIGELEAEMKTHSNNLEFERAQELKEQITGLRALQEKQAIERSRRYDEDIMNYLVSGGKVYLVLFNVRKGVLHNKQEFELDYSEDWFGEFLREYYSSNPVPEEVIIPGMPESGEAIERFLVSAKGSPVKFVVPERGEKKSLLELVKNNIEFSLFKNLKKLEALQDSLGLDELPAVIECFDISHLSGTSAVGSMVRFRNGEPDKSGYRRFRIKSFEGSDDFRAIAEIVRRRYSRILRERGGLPDLIVIDGGKGQLSSASEELKKLEVKTPIISIAKEFEEIYTLDSPDPLKLESSDPGLQLVQSIRDEAHRFAIAYHRLLRKKRLGEE